MNEPCLCEFAYLDTILQYDGKQLCVQTQNLSQETWRPYLASAVH